MIFKIEIYLKIYCISIFSLFFWFSNMILSDASILPASPLQTQQVMTSQIRSHMEYLIPVQTSSAHLVVKIDENSSHNCGF